VVHRKCEQTWQTSSTLQHSNSGPTPQLHHATRLQHPCLTSQPYMPSHLYPNHDGNKHAWLLLISVIQSPHSFNLRRAIVLAAVSGSGFGATFAFDFGFGVGISCARKHTCIFMCQYACMNRFSYYVCVCVCMHAHIRIYAPMYSCSS
jgi:hypothetical protein